MSVVAAVLASSADGPSMGAVSTALLLVFAAIAFIGVIGAATVVVGSSRVKQNLELLRGEVSDLTAAKARVEGERDQIRVDMEKLRDEAAVLRDLATSRPDVEALIGEIRTMVKSIETGHREISRTVVDGLAHATGER